MRRLLLLAVTSLPLTGIAAADSVSDITDAAQLAAALAQAGEGDVLTLGADIVWAGPGPISIPSGVILDGNRFKITSTLPSGALVNQSRRVNVVIRNAELTTNNYGGWALAVADGDLTLRDCTVRCRMIAWARGSLLLENCRHRLQLPAGNDFTEPIGIYGASAVLAATNCVFHFGWDEQHINSGYFHNFGGSPASRLTLHRCTILGQPDPNYGQSSRHQVVFLSDNAAGPDYRTEVSNSIIMAEVVSVFSSPGNGTVISRYNNNAGMLRSPGIMAGGHAEGPRFYGTTPQNTKVSDRTGDIEERNPFVDALNGDWRLVRHSSSATGGEGGGPMGADLGVAAREHNAYNLDFARGVPVAHRTRGFNETLFDGWGVRRDSDQQLSFAVPDGFCGAAMRQRIMGHTGGIAMQTAYQTFVTIPGYTYVVRAYARRSAVAPAAEWTPNGQSAQGVLGAADGFSTDPRRLLTSTVIEGGDGQWTAGEIQIVAPSNQLTIHLIHRATGGWNQLDWGRVSIAARGPINTAAPQGLLAPVLGYIDSIPPESPEARATRLQKVAQRRAGVPIIVHRGASEFDPENTLEAYDRAMELGADGVEFDPRATLDGVLYTLHDAEVDRMLQGTGRGDRMTYYQLASLRFRVLKGRATASTRVPTIISLFELARRRAMLLHFDVKEFGIEHLLIALVDRMDMWDHVVMVTPADESNRIRFHPKARLLSYKEGNPNWSNPQEVAAFLNKPGQMVFMQYDPTPAVVALQKPVPGFQPLPDELRAWWWPDGFSLPVGAPAPTPGTSGMIVR